MSPWRIFLWRRFRRWLLCLRLRLLGIGGALSGRCVETTLLECVTRVDFVSFLFAVATLRIVFVRFALNRPPLPWLDRGECVREIEIDFLLSIGVGSTWPTRGRCIGSGLILIAVLLL